MIRHGLFKICLPSFLGMGLLFLPLLGAMAQVDVKTVDPGHSLRLSEGFSSPGGDLVERIYGECKDKAPGAADMEDSPKRVEFEQCVEDQLKQRKAEIEQFKAGVAQEREAERETSSVERDLLREYLRERFREKVTGKGTGEEKFVDHALFFDFYDSQLSKMLTLTVNSYCMYAEMRGGLPIISSNPEEKRRIAESAERKELLKNESMAEEFIGKCVLGINKVCHDSHFSEESKDEACRVMERLRKINRMIVSNRKSRDFIRCEGKFINSNHCKSKDGGVALAMAFYNPGERGKSIDDVTSLTSGEFQKNVIDKIEAVCPSMKEGASPDTLPSEECLQKLKVSIPVQQGAGGIAGDGEEKKLEDEKKILAQFQIQTLIVKKKIKDSDGSDYLEEQIEAQGGSIQEIVGQVARLSEEQVEKVRREMEIRYHNEREASFKKLIQRLKGEGEIQGELTPEKIAESMRKNNRDTRQLIFFNNVVTGYLKVVSEKDGEIKSQGRNLSSFEREIANSFLGDSQEQFEEDLSEHLSKLKEEEGAVSGGGGDSGRVNPTMKPEDVYKSILQDSDSYREQPQSKQQP